MPNQEDPDPVEQVTEWAPQVRWPRGDGVIHVWTGTPSEDEQQTRYMAGYLAQKVPGAVGAVVTRTVSRTPWVSAGEV